MDMLMRFTNFFIAVIGEMDINQYFDHVRELSFQNLSGGTQQTSSKKTMHHILNKKFG